MSRRVIYFFIVILLLFLLISKINATVHSTTLYYALRVQKNYLNFLHKINNSIDRCFEQALLIDSLRKKIITLEEKQYRTDSFNQELKTIYKQYNTNIGIKPHSQLVRTVSYVVDKNLNRLWAMIDNFDKEKIYGLIYKNQTAGIIASYSDQPMILLNYDKDCSYSVFVGKEQAPGIARGYKNNLMMVEFIPQWMKINIGDKVLTSGMDKLFYEGVEVGVVKEVIQSQGYQNAIIKPYADVYHTHYFHAVSTME